MSMIKIKILSDKIAQVDFRLFRLVKMLLNFS